MLMHKHSCSQLLGRVSSRSAAKLGRAGRRAVFALLRAGELGADESAEDIL